MHGAILGDIIGSPYEFDMGNKTKCCSLFSGRSTYTVGSIAEGFYGVPEPLKQECRKRLPPQLSEVLLRFDSAEKR